MLLFSNPQLLLYQELGSRGGWDGSVGSTHTERGYGTPLEPSPPSIVRWLPRTQQDRRNANVRIVQRYVIVIRDRTSTRSNALIANLPAESPDEFAPDCNCSRATLNFAIERIDRRNREFVVPDFDQGIEAKTFPSSLMTIIESNRSTKGGYTWNDTWCIVSVFESISINTHDRSQDGLQVFLRLSIYPCFHKNSRFQNFYSLPSIVPPLHLSFYISSIPRPACSTKRSLPEGENSSGTLVETPRRRSSKFEVDTR